MYITMRGSKNVKNCRKYFKLLE